MEKLPHKGGRPMSQAMQERFRRIDERLRALEHSTANINAVEREAARPSAALALPDELQGLVLLLRAIGLNDVLRKHLQVLLIDALEAGLPSDERELSHFLQHLRSLHQRDVRHRDAWVPIAEQGQGDRHGRAEASSGA